MTAKDANYLAEGEGSFEWTYLGGRLGDGLAFLIPALQFVQIQVVGTLYAADLICLAVFLFAFIPNAQLLNGRLPRVFIGLGCLWLLAQVTTDLIRSTPFFDYARGWAMIVFTLTNFGAMYLLLGLGRRRIILCALGFVSGYICAYFLAPNFYAAAYPWKFGLGYPITLFIVLVATFSNAKRRLWGAGIVMMIAAALNLYNDFRSLAGECFLTATYSLIRLLTHRPHNPSIRVSLAGAFAAYAILAISGACLFRMYDYGASNGMLGLGALERYEAQSSGQYGVLVGGRGDFLAGLEAAMDSPIIGHGSWAKDWRYASRQEAMLSGFGYQPSGQSDSWIIPEHSYLVGAWVHAGLLGALFWLWVLVLPVRVLSALHSTTEPIAPLISFLALNLIWNVLFSPYGADQRLLTPFSVVTLIWFLDTYKQSDRAPVDQAPHYEILHRHNFV